MHSVYVTLLANDPAGFVHRLCSCPVLSLSSMFYAKHRPNSSSRSDSLSRLFLCGKRVSAMYANKRCTDTHIVHVIPSQDLTSPLAILPNGHGAPLPCYDWRFVFTIKQLYSFDPLTSPQRLSVLTAITLLLLHYIGPTRFAFGKQLLNLNRLNSDGQRTTLADALFCSVELDRATDRPTTVRNGHRPSQNVCTLHSP